MRLAHFGAGTALSFLVVVVGCSQSPSHSSPREVVPTASTSQAIQGGSADGTAHPFAVGVCINPTNGSCGEYCSGALILPNVVVTARHCVDFSPKIVNCGANPSFGAPNGPMRITTNPTMPAPPMIGGSTTGAGWHNVASFSLPTDKHICGNDIALLILADVVPASEAKPVTPGVQYPMTDFYKHPHRTLTAIGFGNTGPTGFTAGTRRIRSPIDILCIPGDSLIPCPADFNANEFYSDDGTCEGDSGSSAYDAQSVTDNAPFTFGVLSRGGDNAGDAGQAATLCKGGLYTRLDMFRDLVVQTADSASKNWTLYPKPVPDWTVYVPPPVDAGVDAAPPPPKAPRANGVACDVNADCASKVCADVGPGKACTTACDESVTPSTCATGYVCKAAVCVFDPGASDTPTSPAAAPTTQSATTSGCDVAAGAGRPGSSRSPYGPLGALGISGVAALVLAARRRRDRAR